MKLTKKILKQIIKEELLTERLKRFKVYVSGESEPLILMGKNEKEVKQTAHMMIKNSSVKIRKVVKEEKLTEVTRIGVEFKVNDFISAMKVFQSEKPTLFNKLLKRLRINKSDWEKAHSSIK